MLALYVALLATARLAIAVDDNPVRNVHAAVAFIRSGETTPMIAPGDRKLTPLGAQQMHFLGRQLRGRYIGDPFHDGLGHDPIPSLSPNELNPDQLLIQTLDKPHLSTSAQALLQGLYPPYSSDATRNGMNPDAKYILTDGSAVDWPLEGYQYANVLTAGEGSVESVWVAWSKGCPMSVQASDRWVWSAEFKERRDETEGFYRMIGEDMLGVALDEGEIDFENAIEIYDALSYADRHDQDIHDMFNKTPEYAGALDQLKFLADESAWHRWGNIPPSSPSLANKTMRAMAGRTLAALVLGQLQRYVDDNSPRQGGPSTPTAAPLTLLFGDHEPMISLFSLMVLDRSNPSFRALPPFGSALLFELFSIGGGDENASLPADPSDLWVRLNFQNGTDFQRDLLAYSMFGNGHSNTDLRWDVFEQEMGAIMTERVVDWCAACWSTALFCSGVYDVDVDIVFHTAGKRAPLSNAVAGVIGAVVTLAVAGLAFAALMLLGGVRFRRVESSPLSRRRSELGGFKGSAKLASDPDVSLVKAGVLPAGLQVTEDTPAAKKPTHERVGSWEMRAKEQQHGSGDLAEGRLGEESPRDSFEAIEAAMRPVEPNVRF